MIEGHRPTGIQVTSFLPHESALAAAQAYTGLPFHVTGFGAVGGGTIPAVWKEVINAQQRVDTTLDTPNPINRSWQLKKPLPFSTLLYDLPRDEKGDALSWNQMIPYYSNDPDWMNQHIEHRSQPGKHLVLAHHTVGVAMETILGNQLPNGKDRIVAMRYHSQLLPATQAASPGYFLSTYGSIDPQDLNFRSDTKYLWDTQMQAVQAGDIHFISTDPERIATINAVVQNGWLSREQAENRFMTVPISIDTEKFQPDPDGSKRLEQIRNMCIRDRGLLNLDYRKRFIGTVSRRDHEKNIWDLVKAYGQFIRSIRESDLDTLPDLLIIGGPTNKPGVVEKEQSMHRYLDELPEKLRSKIHISLTPHAHEEVVHIMDMEIYPSWEESFNISEKEARAAGKLVALSRGAVGHQGTNTQDTAVWFDPLPLDEDLGNAVSFNPVFHAAMEFQNSFNPKTKPSKSTQKYVEIAYTGRNHVNQNFSSNVILDKTLSGIDRRFPGFFTPDQYSKIYHGVQMSS
ncbi:MAG: hypothetical protein O3B87_05520 [bacterium]|nr:hypothetical protein [bacterium]